MKHPFSDIRPMWTVKDLCLYLKVHPSTIYRLLKAGDISAVKIGRDWCFDVEEIERWINRERG